MSVGSKLKETPQSVWKDLEKMGSRLFFTIPFGSNVDNMSGFLAVTDASAEGLPMLTLCVGKVNEGSIVSTVIFPSSKEYSKFTESLYTDSVLRFDKDSTILE